MDDSVNGESDSKRKGLGGKVGDRKHNSGFESNGANCLIKK